MSTGRRKFSRMTIIRTLGEIADAHDVVASLTGMAQNGEKRATHDFSKDLPYRLVELRKALSSAIDKDSGYGVEIARLEEQYTVPVPAESAPGGQPGQSAGRRKFPDKVKRMGFSADVDALRSLPHQINIPVVNIDEVTGLKLLFDFSAEERVSIETLLGPYNEADEKRGVDEFNKPPSPSEGAE